MVVYLFMPSSQLSILHSQLYFKMQLSRVSCIWICSEQNKKQQSHILHGTVIRLINLTSFPDSMLLCLSRACHLKHNVILNIIMQLLLLQRYASSQLKTWSDQAQFPSAEYTKKNCISAKNMYTEMVALFPSFRFGFKPANKKS